MNIRVATSLMAAIAIAIFTGSFVGRDVYAAQVDGQESLQQSQHKIATGKAWQDAKDGAQSTMDDLQKAYEKARARFSNKTE